MILNAFILTLSYLIGAIPFGYLFTKKYKHLKITEIGSGNIGSTNVRRIAGKKLSFCTQLCDLLKGLLPVLLYQILLKIQFFIHEHLIYFIALACIIGHDYSIYIKFKGGKGVNTTLGASLIITPVPTIIALLVYVISKKLFRYTSVGSIFIAFTLPIAGYFISYSKYDFYYLLTVSILILILHTKNIIRLIKGIELQ